MADVRILATRLLGGSSSTLAAPVLALAVCAASLAEAPALAQSQRAVQTQASQPLPALGNGAVEAQAPERTATTGIGQVGDQLNDRYATLQTSVNRLDTRINTRIANRLRTRIDDTYNPIAAVLAVPDPTAPTAAPPASLLIESEPD